MSKTTQRDWLVSTDWLADHLSAPDLVVVDASWHLPGTDRDGHAEYLQQRIAGAVFFDIDDVADTETDLPHMLPSPVKFAARVRKLGIGDGARVIVYDSLGMFSAARVWWMFRVMGHDDIAVLDGGLPKWLAEDRPTREGPPRKRSPRHFTARKRPAMVHDVEDMITHVQTAQRQILDARPAARFKGGAPEPRVGLRSGHMPGALNIPILKMMTDDGTFLEPDALRAVFEAEGVDLNKPVVTTCGSGVTAAVLSLALSEVGHIDQALYDGSWSEWGGRDDLPLETG